MKRTSLIIFLLSGMVCLAACTGKKSGESDGKDSTKMEQAPADSNAMKKPAPAPENNMKSTNTEPAPQASGTSSGTSAVNPHARINPTPQVKSAVIKTGTSANTGNSMARKPH